MFEVIAFYTFGALTLCAFLIVVMSNNILYALSALAFGMILVSSFFFLLQADFLGVVQIIVYTGAIVVMYAFGMMFFDTNKEVKEKFHNQFFVWSITGAMALALLIIVGNINESFVVAHEDFSTNALAHLLFKEYFICFEAAAIMLLMAMIAGIGAGAHKPELTESLQKSVKNESSLYNIQEENRGYKYDNIIESSTIQYDSIGQHTQDNVVSVTSNTKDIK
ncbi:NADH-quinone oxidoreductase subunit J [Helicobacter didelphidarum]|uniref:NADH-quinone oxidoreductase subunit J n=1 Tax=Helicobacter didelphidarum TaxID=2040648 RepID=A0A3D8IBP9_9HELI|nr:NADH-quinone oxidoreductase subunit J [Helicobacter didelphidarum]RDU62603.1 NADH-quinone oxidoreductase subunit J [Helicobacter didelphidarum]